MDAEALRGVMGTPESDIPSLRSLVMEALWFKCSSFERQQELVLVSESCLMLYYSSTLMLCF